MMSIKMKLNTLVTKCTDFNFAHTIYARKRHKGYTGVKLEAQ